MMDEFIKFLVDLQNRVEVLEQVVKDLKGNDNEEDRIINEEELVQYIGSKAFEQAVTLNKEQIQKVLDFEIEFLRSKGLIGD